MSTGGGGGTYAGGVYGEFELDLGSLDDDLNRARTRMAEAAQAMQALEQAFTSGKIGPDEYAASLSELSGRQQTLGALIERLEGQLMAVSAASRSAGEEAHVMAQADAAAAAEAAKLAAETAKLAAQEAAATAAADREAIAMVRQAQSAAAAAASTREAASALLAESDVMLQLGVSTRAEVDALQQLFSGQKAAAAASTQVNAGMQAVHRGSGNASLGLLAVGQAVDDAQYGFRGIANNLPQIAMMFGGGAGLGGAVAIAATAINQLLMHWDQLAEAMAMSPVRSEVERMHDLAAATHETAAAQDKLNDAKREEQEIEALRQKRTPEQEGRARGVAEAIAGAGGGGQGGFDRIAKSLYEARESAGMNPKASGEDIRQVGDPLGQTLSALRRPFENILQREERLREVERAANLQQAQRDVNAAAADPTGGALRRLIDGLKTMPGSAQLRKDLEAQTPEGKAAAEQETIDAQERRAVRKAAIEAEKKAAREAQAQADAEQMMRKAALKDREDVLKREESAERKRQDREEKEYEQAAKQAPGRAKETVFGLEQATHDQMKQDVFSGKSFAEAAGRAGLEIEAKLKALGWDPDLAREAGVGMAEDERKKFSRASAEALFAPDKEERRKSEMYAAESAWSHIQGSIGGKEDISSKQLEQQLLMAAALREIAANQAQANRRQPVAVLK